MPIKKRENMPYIVNKPMLDVIENTVMYSELSDENGHPRFSNTGMYSTIVTMIQRSKEVGDDDAENAILFTIGLFTLMRTIPHVPASFSELEDLLTLRGRYVNQHSVQEWVKQALDVHIETAQLYRSPVLLRSVIKMMNECIDKSDEHFKVLVNKILELFCSPIFDTEDNTDSYEISSVEDIIGGLGTSPTIDMVEVNNVRIETQFSKQSAAISSDGPDSIIYINSTVTINYGRLGYKIRAGIRAMVSGMNPKYFNASEINDIVYAIKKEPFYFARFGRDCDENYVFENHRIIVNKECKQNFNILSLSKTATLPDGKEIFFIPDYEIAELFLSTLEAELNIDEQLSSGLFEVGIREYLEKNVREAAAGWLIKNL